MFMKKEKPMKQEEPTKQRKPMKQKKQAGQQTVNAQLNSIFLQAMICLSSIALVLVLLIVILTISNREIFERYGAGQGKAGSIEIQFSSFHEELRYLVFETRGEGREEYIADIEAQAIQLQEAMQGLKMVMHGKENLALYSEVLRLSEEYQTTVGEILAYEKESGKYNAEKIYNKEATEIAREMKEVMKDLFHNMSVDGNTYFGIFMGVTVGIIVLVIAAGSLIIAFSVRKTRKAIADICRPLEELTGCSREISKGNLHVLIDYQEQNEIGALSQSLHETVEALNGYIEDISHRLEKIADYRLADSMIGEYSGDFIPIRNSLIRIQQSLRDIFSKIDSTSDEVYSGAEQVEGSAKNLQEGTLLQNRLMDEIMAEIRGIATEADENLGMCEHAGDVAKETILCAEDEKEKMDVLIQSMAVITDKSNRISEVLKSIDEIAQQTNLLSLNAGIEAARAGEMGRGFAVVASEVSTLADKCAAAAKETADMIEETKNAIAVGRKETDQAFESIQKMSVNIKNMDDVMKEIRNGSGKQRNAIAQITEKVEEIVRILNSNVQTAKLSASASEQLSQQAEMLKNILEGVEL